MASSNPPPYGATDPLLISAAPSSAHPAPDADLPDDFKYSVTAAQSSVSIRHDFIRKVYSILAVQLLATLAVSATFIFVDPVREYVQANRWMLITAVVSSFVLLLGLIWKRTQHPVNMYLLAAFTLSEAYTVGVLVTFYDAVIVLQALIITAGMVLGLTAFTVQSRWDFSRMGPYLFAMLCALVLVGILQIFLPFSRMLDLAIAVITAIVFSGYIIYDTHQIMNRVAVDEYVLASVDLYLDVLNLFVAVLRILSDTQSE